MNSKKTALICWLLAAALFTCAQEKKTKPKEYKYGKIDLLEFEIKVSGTDSAASAVVLCDIGRGNFDQGGAVYNFERHVRYKILTKDGYDYANLEIQLYRRNGSETKITSFDGATYNLEGGKIVADKITKSAKFSEKQDKNYTLKKFTLPNVKVGSIIEFKYTLQSDFIYTLRPWEFQKEIPTLYSSLSIGIPEFFRYRINPSGYVYLHPYQESVNGGTFYHYYATEVPGLKKENFVTTMKDFVSKVTFELSSVAIPGQVYRDFTTTWPKVAESLKNDENFGRFIEKTSYSKTLLKEILKDNTNPDTSILLIFNYVKTHIKWNKDLNFYTTETNPKTIFEKKAGNSADINLCLLGLLQEAKISASPVLLSTRENGTHPGLPMLTEFDNVIVDAVAGDKHILLDATDKNHVPGLIAYANLNHQGMLLDLYNPDGKWISLDNNVISKKTYSYLLNLDKENKFSGKLFITSTAYEALQRRDKYLSATSESDFLKDYKQDKPGLTIKKYEIFNAGNPAESLSEAMEIEIEDNIEEAGNLAYFTPLLYEKTKENPFKLEERKFPVDFGYPSEENYRITLVFPDNYTIDKVPKNEKVMLPDERASFTFIFALEGNKLMLNSKIIMKSAQYSPEEYHYLKELFMNVVRKQAEQIVFKKN